MKKNYLSLLILMMFFAVTSSAQRAVDKLDRGLVAVKTTKGVFVSWRIQSEEYYGVTYNLYRNGTKIAEKLKTSNYTDAAGTTSSTYQVAAVVRGVEQAKTAATSTWANDYMEIVPKHPAALTSTYIPNDACCADVDGDGVVEILLKYTNKEEQDASFPKAGNNGEYSLFEVLKLDGTVLWWVNCGPNMGDFQNNEQNIVGYDWDLDGKAEVVMRLSEGATIHYANGDTYTIGADGKNGTAWTNYRIPKTGGTEWFTHYGNEFLLYCNGSTGEPYQCMEYPLKRLEAGETDLNKAWGDGYGHRSSKFFFGAPYLDGRKPSIFLGRGIYTRHKFVALDVNPETHELTTRWRWTNNQKGSPWYGQGYHNYSIVDVDWDGRDEIVWGSMVIDDNGKGLSTTGLGHGDAQHHGDFNPYVRGQEGFFCNEDRPSNNYRDLTTSKIYHRATGSNDDGRAIAGNFNNVYPGAMGFSAHDDAISCVTGEAAGTKTGVGMNFNTYWDGDLCEETFNGGINTPGYIYKYGSDSAIKEFAGSITNNHSKSTPCFKGDILGDWREEFIMRTAANNIRIYTTTIETPWRNYSLWYDHQYRNGMVWQMCGYNQPPHVSYFLGELEGITQAPPSLGMTGRTEIANGQTISAKEGDIITCETNDMTVTVADGATPYIYIDNAPSWTQGSAPSEATAASYPINTTYYTHTLKGGAFAGEMRLVKQGEGILVLPDVTQLYSGSTDVWAGTLSFNGTLQNSRLWLNRLTTLDTDGGKFMKGIQADYGAVIRPGGKEAKAASLTTDSLILNFGAVCELDIYSDGFAADQLNANVLKIEKKVWPNGGGPEYDTPVFRINAHAAAGAAAIADGKYCLGAVAKIDGDLANIMIEGLTHQKASLSCEDGKLYLNVQSYEGADMTWVGDKSGNWNLDNEANFKSDETGEAVKFVTGSNVTFDDNANVFTVKVDGKVAPASVTFNNTKAYTVTGDSIIGGGDLTKSGIGTVTINNINHIGNTVIRDGALYASSFANTVGSDFGSLGDIRKTITLLDRGALGVSASTTNGQRLIVGEGRINVGNGATLTQSGDIAGQTGMQSALTKIGAGTLTLPGNISVNKLIIQAGTVNTVEKNGVNMLPATVEFTGGSLVDTNSEGSYSSNNANFVVASGQTGALTMDPRCNYTGTLTGAGTFTVTAGGVRNYVDGNWSDFEGELVVKSTKRGTYDPMFFWNNSYGIPNATLNVATGYVFDNNGKNVSVKMLKGTASASGTLQGSGTYIFGENCTTAFTPYAYITSPIILRGSEGCEMRVSTTTVGRISNAIAVEAGSLRFNSVESNTNMCNGSKLVTVTGTGKVYGTRARFFGVQASAGGTFSITGTSDAPTTIQNGGGVSRIGNGGIFDFKIKSASNYSRFICSGYLQFQTGAVLQVRFDDAYTPVIGDTFTLWTAGSVMGCTSTNISLVLPELPAGMVWDDSKLYNKEGVLSITAGTAVGALPADANLIADVVAVDGTVIARINTTKATLNADVRKVAGVAGTYVLHFVSGTSSKNMTVVVK
ncbi:MAG: autotransporter-associated beta strand repeat-containing protein [Prevotella sp.]|nr:autotransporter-associated beta strand repeat-containing protein [Prevotella sp.]